jgi:hypothetical protein
LQCFARGCLCLQAGGAERLPLGELVLLGEAGFRPATGPSSFTLDGPFADYWSTNGGAAAFGPPISGEITLRDRVVQYTRYARLERPLEGGVVRLGALGFDYLRLPGGGPYRWMGDE